MDNRKNAIIIALHKDISEIIQLAESLDLNIVHTFIQNRDYPFTSTYIGSGKLEEIKGFIEESNSKIDLVIVDGELKPSQWFILEKEFGITVYDRLRLILMIFRDRADRKEAKLQVRLAELHYEKPFVRELIHRARSGEHPGYMAGGEYQVDDYYEMIKKQMRYIKEELDKIRRDRRLRRQHRHIGGYYLVSLAGYTNTGKSSLLNLLSNEKVTVEDRLFSTLSTTTRKLPSYKLPVLITDTVGFIQRLPAWMIDAFHSTLEEIGNADVVLLVCDVSDELDILVMKLQTSLNELMELGVTAPIIIVLNKIDSITKEELRDKMDYIRKLSLSKYRSIIPVSVKTRENIDLLLDTIYDLLPQISHITLTLPNLSSAQSFISWLYEKTNVISISYGRNISLNIECNPKLRDKIISTCKKLNGTYILKDS